MSWLDYYFPLQERELPPPAIPQNVPNRARNPASNTGVMACPPPNSIMNTPQQQVSEEAARRKAEQLGRAQANLDAMSEAMSYAYAQAQPGRRQIMNDDVAAYQRYLAGRGVRVGDDFAGGGHVVRTAADVPSTTLSGVDITRHYDRYSHPGEVADDRTGAFMHGENLPRDANGRVIFQRRPAWGSNGSGIAGYTQGYGTQG